MGKENTIKSLAIKYSWMIITSLIVYFIISVAIIYSNDLIANSMDIVLSENGEIDIKAIFIKMIIVILIVGIGTYINNYLAKYYSVKIQTEFKNQTSRKIPNIEYRYFDEHGSGGIINKLISDVRELERILSDIVPNMSSAIIIVVTVLGYLMYMDWQLGIVIMIAYPVLMILANKIGNKVKKLANIRRNKLDERTEIAYDCVQGIIVGKSYNLEEIQDERIGKVINEVFKNEKKRTQTTSKGFVIEVTIGWIPQIICYIIALFEVISGKITAGEMLTFSVLLGVISRTIGDIPMYLIDFKESLISVKRLNELMMAEEEESGEYCGDITERAIEFENVDFSYSKGGEKILKGVNFTVKKGKQTAVIGSSGGGKTTIFKIICGYYPIDNGTYKLFGENFSKWNIKEARKKFSLVSQNIFLLPESIAENISYGKPNATREEIVEACKNANVHEFIMSLPDKYETMVGERGIRLSGGERQRISIARAFLKDAPILLLDEPTAAIDVATEKLIQEAIDRISLNKTVILIAHRLNTVVNADEILVLADGKITERGTHTELINLGGTYANLYGKQQEGGWQDEN